MWLGRRSKSPSIPPPALTEQRPPTPSPIGGEGQGEGDNLKVEYKLTIIAFDDKGMESSADLKTEEGRTHSNFFSMSNLW